MAHALTTNMNGQVEFAYREADGLPWHGLGQSVPEGADVDTWKRLANMEWRIQRSKVRYAVERSGDAMLFREMPEQHVLFRSDNKEPLGLVSDRYKVVQPGEVIEFFRDIAKAGGLDLSAAGTIFGGKRFWATAKIGEAAPLSVRDKIGGFILISTSADGSLATEVRRTTVRVVCSNTLAMAQRDVAASVKVSHKSVFRPEEVKAFMGLNETAWEAFRKQIVRLGNIELRPDHAKELTLSLMGGNASPQAKDKVLASTGYNKILQLFNGGGKGANFDGVRDTAWGWVNAVTEYADWWARARTHENRFVSANWGTNAAMKQEALTMALALSN